MHVKMQAKSVSKQRRNRRENLKDGMPIFPIHNLVFFSAMLVLHPNLIWLWTNYCCLQLRTNERTQDANKPVFDLLL